jgi:hypothetical protein
VEVKQTIDGPKPKTRKHKTFIRIEEAAPELQLNQVQHEKCHFWAQSKSLFTDCDESYAYRSLKRSIVLLRVPKL